MDSQHRQHLRKDLAEADVVVATYRRAEGVALNIREAKQGKLNMCWSENLPLGWPSSSNFVRGSRTKAQQLTAPSLGLLIGKRDTGRFQVLRPAACG